jgi:hypothetical protein
MKQANASTHEEGVTQPAQLCFYNKSGCSVHIVWLDYESRARKFNTLHPGGSCAQSEQRPAAATAAGGPLGDLAAEHYVLTGALWSVRRHLQHTPLAG